VREAQARKRELEPSRRLLPIWACREALCAEVRESRVLVVVGETGSGKSTQLPQFLLQVRPRASAHAADAAAGETCASPAHVSRRARCRRTRAGRPGGGEHRHRHHAAAPRGRHQPRAARRRGNRRHLGTTASASVDGSLARVTLFLRAQFL
jgi:hypothetical protein